MQRVWLVWRHARRNSPTRPSSAASREYDDRASAAEDRAMVGTAGAILHVARRIRVALSPLGARALESRSVSRSRTRDWPQATPGGAHRRPHRPAQPPRADRRPRGRAGTAASGERVLALFDLDGFKQLQRHLRPSRRGRAARPAGRAAAGRRRAASGTAYRMGGDEFCVLADAPARTTRRSSRSPPTRCRESGDAFEIGCSQGSAVAARAKPPSPEEALRLADQRMYEHKASAARRPAARAATCS